MATEVLLQWSDDFNVGIQEVDEQHKALVGMLNELHRAIVEHHGKEMSRKILDQLADYTRTHFLLEESLMRVTHYPGFDIHKQQHEELIKQVVDLQQKLDVGGATITFELLHFLKVWLAQHINESDKRFGGFFKSTDHLKGYANWSQEVSTTMKKKKWWWKFW
jgi:hemerythrin